MLLEATLVNQHTTADAKIRLFRSLFRGRDDVYPRRFESRKTGKSGYAPACGNEWIRGICEKPRIIACAEDYPQHIGLPRGCIDDVQQLLSDLNISAVVRDERCQGQPLHVTFQGTLRPEQKEAADAMLAHEIVVLAATTACGK